MTHRTSTFPRLLEIRERLSSVSIVRQRVAEAALGHVLELGGESGANLFLYPPSITSLTSLATTKRLPPSSRHTTRRLHFPVDRRLGSLSEFPLKDHAYDTVVSTFALSAAQDLARTLEEVKRVLKPGGRLLFLEYGLSRNEAVARWQRRCAPLHRALSGAQQPLQYVDEEIVSAGFSLKHVRGEYLGRLPRALGFIYEGIAFNGD
jgi:SAM-dependent methyltransferase